jgi:hypothetical protein
MPSSGTPPAESGLSWFGVESIVSFLSFQMSQAQPLPKTLVAAAAKVSWNLSKPPKAASMA